ncbi:RepB DNA-primase [Azotobacter beijerinckii]|uniref:RepB DNA-primase n=1 Tax=Azotobacter beijerinckii TaxID=170623 RepID=A0A1H6QXI4_9GAMM|nr:DNA-primase RepB domain-containing protein [Azotobacter beijerinckii]SEI48478.1 RepB DNA-primase [Azotobacter beijerinckii]
MNAAIPLAPAEAARFLAALDPTATAWTFQTFDDSPAKRPQLARTLHGTLAEHAAELTRLNAAGAGVFITPNETDGAGRKAENIIRVRAAWADFDNPAPDTLEHLGADPLPPSIIVESSAGKWHAYWLADGVALGEFKPLQQAIARHWGSDPAVCDLPRVMRLPGFQHRKGEPQPVTLLEAPCRRYSRAELLGRYPLAPQPTPKPASVVAPSPTDKTTPYGAAALARACATIAAAVEGTRNHTLNLEAFGIGQLAGGGEIETGEAWHALEDAAERAGLEAGEIATTLNSAFTSGFAEPRAAGADPARAFATAPELPPGASMEPTGEVVMQEEAQEQKPETGQSSMLVKFVGTRAELFHDDNKDVFAKDRQTGEVRALDTRQFKDWLAAEFYKATGKAARSQSISEALGTLSGLGRFDGPCQRVHLRTAGAAGAYSIDLAISGSSRAVRIRPGAWELVEAPGVMFLRPESMQPLPEPVRGGSIDPLWRVANVPEGSRLLALTWLVECLRPDTPYPVLELLGEQGSAKSTTQTALRRLIDPNACDLRGAPKTVEDIFVAAGACALVSYENLSYLPPAMQDALCVLATGGGHATRKLFTNAEEAIIRVKRPIVLNGIAAAITAQDLVDRAITIEPPSISERREEEAALWAGYDAERPRMLGALLDIAAKALELLPNMQIPPAERPRLLDFARLGMAVAAAVGRPPGDFLAEFNAARQESLARTIDSSPVASAVLTWLEKVPAGRTAPAGTLMTELSMHRGGNMDTWPKTAKGFADALRRAAPALRQLGIECRCLGKIGGSVKWAIHPSEK